MYALYFALANLHKVNINTTIYRMSLCKEKEEDSERYFPEDKEALALRTKGMSTPTRRFPKRYQPTKSN
jgi:hypothetical protein